MQHRDHIILQKILDESNIAIQLLDDAELSEFMESELLKRAIGMTVINIGELVKILLTNFAFLIIQFLGKRFQGFVILQHISIKHLI